MGLFGIVTAYVLMLDMMATLFTPEKTVGVGRRHFGSCILRKNHVKNVGFAFFKEVVHKYAYPVQEKSKSCTEFCMKFPL